MEFYLFHSFCPSQYFSLVALFLLESHVLHHHHQRPTPADIQRLLQMGEVHGFPGMLGSLDCMHWEWKNCPVVWKGQFTRGDYGVSTVMLEAVASQDTWIWHSFFGVAGSNNDLNVLNQSPLFTEVLEGRAPPVQFTVNQR
uniref:DDE Tnp4 domain-containing protein n=1 Tax=Aegilops tauschii subsp. strangulata TaxID=200361 RepID=A0A452YLB5_AEGTS